MSGYYAHSGNAEQKIAPQLYGVHVCNVISRSNLNVDTCLKNTSLSLKHRIFFRDIVAISAAYHDLGKLDSNTQSILSQVTPPETKLINHVDAGVAFLLRKFNDSKDVTYLISAFFVLCHHIGLQDWNEYISERRAKAIFSNIEFIIKNSFRCDFNIKEKYDLNIDSSLKDYTNLNIDNYIDIHHALVAPVVSSEKRSLIPITPLQLRMAFSCLIEADHYDTSVHFSNGQYVVEFSPLNPTQRLICLDSYIRALPDHATSKKRKRMRTILRDTCKTSPVTSKFYLLDGTVGTGKTCAGLELALRIAEDQHQDRIYNIAPFTNIITQTARVYKDALQLPNEGSHNINEIHCKVEFENPKLRMYNNIWSAPINCTTAVQFIESLSNAHTSSIKKIHQFANSIIILDEFHTMMPYYLWNYVLDVMIDLANNFNTAFIFSSGSSVAYWAIYNKNIDVHQVVPAEIYKDMLKSEKMRVKIKKCPSDFDCPEQFRKMVLKKMESKKVDSAMIVVNTIYSAAILTKEFVANSNGYRIFHLSSYLTSYDRGRVLKEVKAELKRGTKLILVATSIVECGVDMSFKMGFRQKSTATSIMQFNGRVNRECMLKSAYTFVFDFDSAAVSGGVFTENPMFTVGKAVLDSRPINEISPEFCTGIIQQEINSRPKNPNEDGLGLLESKKRFKNVSENLKVIDANTITVITNPTIQAEIESGAYVSYRRIMKHSIQLWFTRTNDALFNQHIKTVTVGEADYQFWTGPYDSVYGIGIIYS